MARAVECTHAQVRALDECRGLWVARRDEAVQLAGEARTAVALERQLDAAGRTGISVWSAGHAAGVADSVAGPGLQRRQPGGALPPGASLAVSVHGSAGPRSDLHRRNAMAACVVDPSGGARRRPPYRAVAQADRARRRVVWCGRGQGREAGRRGITGKLVRSFSVLRGPRRGGPTP